jgi:hypothetical protein
MNDIQETIIVDHYFVDPDEIRAKALSMQYYTCKEGEGSGEWPGLRTKLLHETDAELFNELLYGFCKELNIPEDPSLLVQICFQICSAKDGDSWIHQDYGKDYVGLVYLSPHPPPESGTLLFTPIDKGFNHWDIEDTNNYIQLTAIENKYNRLVSYDPRVFHKSDKYFGVSKEDSRLFLLIFIKKVWT